MGNGCIQTIVGLGNPGETYRLTRHNAGFLFCRALLKRGHLLRKRTIPGLMRIWNVEVLNQTMHIVFPLTFMNRSGDAVREYIIRYHVLPEHLFVIYDDIDLPLGEIRIRKRGGDGGHKGLRDIIQKMETENIPRLRLGIGPVPVHTRVEQYVLSPFQEAEWPIFEGMVERGIEALRVILQEGFEKAMSLYNVRIQWERKEHQQHNL